MIICLLYSLHDCRASGKSPILLLQVSGQLGFWFTILRCRHLFSYLKMPFICMNTYKHLYIINIFRLTVFIIYRLLLWTHFFILRLFTALQKQDWMSYWGRLISVTDPFWCVLFKAGVVMRHIFQSYACAWSASQYSHPIKKA